MWFNIILDPGYVKLPLVAGNDLTLTSMAIHRGLCPIHVMNTMDTVKQIYRCIFYAHPIRRHFVGLGLCRPRVFPISFSSSPIANSRIAEYL